MNKRFRIAFITTVFPVSKLFLKDFFISLKKQTLKKFDILIANDGLKHSEILQYSENLNVSIFDVNYTPTKNREVIIKKALEGNYKYLIFGDSDDYFSQNRIEQSIKLLDKYGVIANVIKPVYENGANKDTTTFNIGDGLFSRKYFFEYNIAGLSNSAVLSDLITFPLSFDNDIIAVDWFFFSQILFYNKKDIFFTSSTKTFYRQHSQNTIGIDKKIDLKHINKVLEVKLVHYRKMAQFFRKQNFFELEKKFERKKNEMLLLKLKLKNKEFQLNYISFIENNIRKNKTGWWSEVVSLSEYKHNKTKP